MKGQSSSAQRLAARYVEPGSKVWKILGALSRVPRNIAQCGKQLIRSLTKNSIFYFEDELWMASLAHPLKLAKTLEHFHPTSVLDLGCGTGYSLDFFLSQGIDAMGVEGSSLAISKALHPEKIRKHNLNRELRLERSFDLVWCVEVAEHIHPKYVEQFMQTLTNHSKHVVLSAAQPGQGGEGHLNEQPPGYWIELFHRHGFSQDVAATRSLQQVDEAFNNNMLVFYRRSPGVD